MVVLFELLLVEGQLQYGLLGELSLAALTDHCCTCTPIPASTLAPTLAAATGKPLLFGQQGHNLFGICAGEHLHATSVQLGC